MAVRNRKYWVEDVGGDTFKVYINVERKRTYVGNVYFSWTSQTYAVMGSGGPSYFDTLQEAAQSKANDWFYN